MPIIGRSTKVEPVIYDDGKTVAGVEKRVLIGPANDAPTFAIRKFTLAPGGYTPHHKHPWEHGVYVLAGKGEIRSAEGSEPVSPGDFALVPPMEEHQFVNTGKEPFEFICVVPLAGEE
ncbi:MAG TPA: cupin domain-containing protein [Candidatus Acetothermia bacterium]|nr:cupin domain-containing protein [Candidatus Acetothermia bacterium]